MSKGMDRKKETKKKPAKTLLEKRAAKAEKKARSSADYPFKDHGAAQLAAAPSR